MPILSALALPLCGFNCAGAFCTQNFVYKRICRPTHSRREPGIIARIPVRGMRSVVSGGICWRVCGARSAFHRRAARRKSTATAKAPNADEQKRGGGRRGTRAARKKAAARAPASKDARAGTTKAADDGTPAITPPNERAQAGGLAAALATAERERTTGTRRAACLNAAPPTREPTVETMDARPKRETRPTGTRTPIAGREARMHERKTLAGQGGHAPPGTSTALKRRLYLGRPKKGAAAEWETRLGRWKQR